MIRSWPDAPANRLAPVATREGPGGREVQAVEATVV